jgi:hypothetical protein
MANSPNMTARKPPEKPPPEKKPPVNSLSFLLVFHFLGIILYKN